MYKRQFQGLPPFQNDVAPVVRDDQQAVPVFQNGVKHGEHMAPVSYTHLDVYKRQEMELPVGRLTEICPV